jgi:hypothetical protein
MTLLGQIRVLFRIMTPFFVPHPIKKRRSKMKLHNLEQSAVPLT